MCGEPGLTYIHALASRSGSCRVILATLGDLGAEDRDSLWGSSAQLLVPPTKKPKGPPKKGHSKTTT